MRKFGLFVAALFLTLVCSAFTFYIPPQQFYPVRIQGAVSCANHDVAGVWIDSSSGGTFANIYPTIPSDVLFQRTLTMLLPTYISLHVGCGKNSDGSWQSDNWTPWQYVSSASTLTLTAGCNEGNMMPHTAFRCTYGYTKLEAEAYKWADGQYYTNNTDYYNLCLTYVRYAYQKGAGVDIQNFTKIIFKNNTFPSNVWPNIWFGWKGTTQPPPPGALVFYLPPNYTLSHVTFSKGDGTELSSPDTFDENGLHVETIAQHGSTYYVGWWLFA